MLQQWRRPAGNCPAQSEDEAPRSDPQRIGFQSRLPEKVPDFPKDEQAEHHGGFQADGHQ